MQCPRPVQWHDLSWAAAGQREAAQSRQSAHPASRVRSWTEWHPRYRDKHTSGEHCHHGHQGNATQAAAAAGHINTFHHGKNAELCKRICNSVICIFARRCISQFVQKHVGGLLPHAKYARWNPCIKWSLVQIYLHTSRGKDNAKSVQNKSATYFLPCVVGACRGQCKHSTRWQAWPTVAQGPVSSAQPPALSCPNSRHRAEPFQHSNLLLSLNTGHRLWGYEEDCADIWCLQETGAKIHAAR